MSYSVVNYLYISLTGLITSVGEEGAIFSATVNLLLCGFCSEGFSHGAWDRLCYFIVALPGPSM